MVDTFLGKKYKLASSENFDEFMKALGELINQWLLLLIFKFKKVFFFFWKTDHVGAHFCTLTVHRLMWPFLLDFDTPNTHRCNKLDILIVAKILLTLVVFFFVFVLLLMR